MLVPSNFSFSHSIFKRLALQTQTKQGLFGKGLRNEQILSLLVAISFSLSYIYIYKALTPCHSPQFYRLRMKAFKNIVDKGENAGNQHISFSHNFFSPSRIKFLILNHIYFVFCKCFQFGGSKIFSLSKE